MFTGIIETVGRITAIEKSGDNTTFTILSDISSDLSIDQSVSHDGVCLTVIETEAGSHKVTAVHETLLVSNLAGKQVGDELNLERCMQMNGRLDGHIVQGHVDATATCTQRDDMNGSVEYVFTFDPSFAALVVEKGSVCINGISLTCFAVAADHFRVAIIPYTFEHTNMRAVQPGSLVNIEFDIIGKFVQRQLALK